MTGNKSIIAYFEVKKSKFTLTTSVQPTGGGSISLSPSGGTYDSGTVVTLTASPASGYNFLNWIDGNGIWTWTSLTVTMTGNKSVTANFLSAPEITKHPISRTVEEGITVTFSVAATGSNLTYQWKQEGKNVGSNSNTYSFTATLSNDGDEIWCVISNAAGSVISNIAELTVTQNISPPVITKHPRDITVEEGDEATFSVTASGSSPLKYQWQRNGKNISGANSSSYTTPSTDMSDDGDLFRCIVENSAGKDTSDDAELTVTFAGLYENRILSCTISNIFFMFRLDLYGSEGSALGGACLSLTNCTDVEEYELELRSNSSGYWYQTIDGSVIKFKLKQKSSGEWIFNQICVGTNCYPITDHGGL